MTMVTKSIRSLLCCLAALCLLIMAAGTAARAEDPAAADAAVTAGATDTPEAENFDDPFDDPFAETGSDVLEIADPVEPFNRAMYWFNDKLYFYLLKPVARGYRVVPEPARVSVSNFFSNLATPVRLVNDLLQFKLRRAGTELARFGVNSTLGLLGLFDPAKSWLKLEKHEEDFGQTLGRYGIGNGFYLVLPVFGPSTLRDGIGRVGDYFVHPISSPYYCELRNWEQYSLNGLEQVNRLSLDRDTYEAIKRESLDPYLFMRNSYLQYRQAKVEE